MVRNITHTAPRSEDGGNPPSSSFGAPAAKSDPAELALLRRRPRARTVDGLEKFDLSETPRVSNGFWRYPYYALVGRAMMLLGGLFHALAPGERLMERTLRRALMPYAGPMFGADAHDAK